MRAYLEINGNALENNYLAIKKETNKDLIAVIKANAYGHGLIECAKILYKNKVPFFAVSTKEEAIMIRKNLIFTPIILLGKCDDYNFLSSYKIHQIIFSLEHLISLAKSPIPLVIHLFIDINMNREGIRKEEIKEALEIIKKSKLILKGVCTHYSSPSNYLEEHAIFLECLKQIPNNKSLIIHTSASSTYKENTDDTLYRVGLSLYGLDNKNTPILTLKAPILRKTKVSKGTPISYEGTELTPSDGYLYTVGLGYGDGWNRNYKTTAYVGEHKLSQIGVTCMDYMMFFSTDNYEENTIFTIFDYEHSVLNIALEQETIPYEIVTKLNSRLKRILIYKK